MRYLTRNGSDRYQKGSSNLLTPYREQPRLTRIVIPPPFRGHQIKGAVYPVWFSIKSWMFLELFLFAKKIEFLTIGDIHCTSRSYLGTFILCAYHRFPEGTKLELGKGAPSEHHPQPTIPPPRLSRPANCDESQLATSLDGESGPTPVGKTFPHSYPKTQVSAGDAYVVCNFLVPVCVFCDLPMCLGTPM